MLIDADGRRLAVLWLLSPESRQRVVAVQFLTLQYVDPATYQIMGNLKIVTTGLLFRLFLRRRLSPLQWIALTLLMIGAATSQVRQRLYAAARRFS